MAQAKHEDFHFRGQNVKEVVKLVVRRHPVVLLNPGYVVLVLMLAPWVVFVFSPGFTAPFAWSLIFATLAAIWVAFIAIYLWYNDLYVITTQRVLTTHQQHLLHRTISEVPYRKVQEISHEVRGLRSTLLNVGNVIIKTASPQNVVLYDVLNPYEIEQTIAKNVHN